MKRIILRDLLYGAGLAFLMYVIGSNYQGIFNRLDTVLFIIVLVAVWFHKKTYNQALKNLISIARILQIPVIISFVALGVSFYMNRYNTNWSVFVMLLASLGSVGMSYILLMNWTLEYKKNGKVDINNHRKILLGIIGLWLLAELILLFVS